MHPMGRIATKPLELGVGSFLNINDECVGQITDMDDVRFFIDAPCFRGWATKAEIYDAIASATAGQYPRTQPRPLSCA